MALPWLRQGFFLFTKKCNEMDKVGYKHKFIRLTIPNGETFNDGDLNLPAGECIGVFTDDYGDPGIPIDISIRDGGDEVIETLPYKALKKTSGGRWTESVMPIGFRCDRKINVRISATAAVGQDVTIDTVFIIKKQESY